MDDKTLEQAATTATMPFIFRHVALMPDAHLGKGATVGSVIPTKDAIMPAAVGVDIGCGMNAVMTDIHIDEVAEWQLEGVRDEIKETIPAGVGQGHAHLAKGEAYLNDHDTPLKVLDDKDLRKRATAQLGTLGSGNHFVEVSTDENGFVWLVLHSGSRGVGNILARHHIKVAQDLADKYMIDLPDRDLAYLVRDTPEFDDYWYDLMWAQNYAAMNRDIMMAALKRAVDNNIGPFEESAVISCHHNFTALEHHYGEDVYVSRKGAIRARKGDFGIIPGSMGTETYITAGKGNPSSFNSSAHGAGRVLSRSAAKRELDADSLRDYMKGKVWLDDRADAFVDEHPLSYKDINQVMEDQEDLVAPLNVLTAVMNYKG